MREIKFRAFVFEEKRYYKQVCHTDDYLYRLINIESSDGVNNSIKVHIDIPFKQTWFTNEKDKESKFVLEQYIGVKGYVGDYKNRYKNEVELYEGDIVEAWSEGSKGIFVITYRTESAPMWLLYPNWQDTKHWNIHGSDLGRQKGDYFDALKVLGNIHENPELLNI